MAEVRERLCWVSAYAVAMALLEAAVVAYLRGLLQVTADRVTLGPYLAIEVWREVATLVMLVSVGWLAGRGRHDRPWYALYAFGLWDIAYYAWLKALLGWPATLLDWDILFLIPLRWWGPVLSPLLIAALICTFAVLALVRTARGGRLEVTRPRLAGIVGGGALALYVFTYDALHALWNGQPDWNVLRPSPFKWAPFLAALALMAGSSLAMVWPRGRAHPSRHMMTQEGAHR